MSKSWVNLNKGLKLEKMPQTRIVFEKYLTFLKSKINQTKNLKYSLKINAL